MQELRCECCAGRERVVLDMEGCWVCHVWVLCVCAWYGSGKLSSLLMDQLYERRAIPPSLVSVCCVRVVVLLYRQMQETKPTR